MVFISGYSMEKGVGVGEWEHAVPTLKNPVGWIDSSTLHVFTNFIH